MRSDIIVVLSPSIQHSADLGKRGEERLVEQFIAQACIEALDESVQCRLAGRDVVPFDPHLLAPAQHGQASEFGAIVGDAVSGWPRWVMITSSSRTTRNPGSEVSATSARHSRVKSSTTARMRKRRLCLSQIKSEYIGDAARPGLEGEEYALPSEPCAIGAHPCPTIGACASHYSSSCKTAARDEDAARRIQQHGQGIPAGSNRSAVQYIPSQ